MLLYIALIGIIAFCYAVFKSVRDLKSLIQIIQTTTEEKNEELKQFITEKSAELSDQILEVNHRIDFYLNNTALVERMGFDNALKHWLQNKFIEEGYSAEQAQFKALLVAEGMQFNAVVFDFLSKKGGYSRFDLEKKFATILSDVELKKEFLYEGKLEGDAYCFLLQIKQDRERYKKNEIFLFKTYPPMGVFDGAYHNSYHSFLHKFFLLDYLTKQGLIHEVDRAMQKSLGINCSASECYFKINEAAATKFLEENKQLKSNCDPEDLEWFKYRPV